MQANLPKKYKHPSSIFLGVYLLFASFFATAPLASQEITNASPQQIEEHYKKALSQFEQGKYLEALELIRQVIKSDMNHYKLRYLAAHSHWRLRNYEPATQHFAVCLYVKPADASAYIDLALMQIEQNQLWKAKKTLETAQAQLAKANQAVSAKMFNVMARIELLQNNSVLALKYSERAKAAYEKNKAGIKDQLESILLEGKAYLLQKQFDKAEISLLWGLSLQPNDATTLNLIGYFYEQWYYFLQQQNAQAESRKDKITKALEHYKKSLATANISDSLKNIVEQNLRRVEGFPVQ